MNVKKIVQALETIKNIIGQLETESPDDTDEVVAAMGTALAKVSLRDLQRNDLGGYRTNYERIHTAMKAVNMREGRLCSFRDIVSELEKASRIQGRSHAPIPSTTIRQYLVNKNGKLWQRHERGLYEAL